ncbi:MAG: diacylglycerol kinase [Gammaproteobacteria bacterium]|nr:diacylglycerol kinase [Pseudomonadales bacterium]MCP5349229.1 diacylglycerol kinase [Pseudomonadales bacterium]
MTDESGKSESGVNLARESRSGTGFGRFIPAMLNSWDGINATLKTESAFRQEMIAFVVLFPLGLWLGESGIEKLMLVAPLFLVLIVELLNTAVESTVDRWGNEYNEFAKAAKDAGSAAVFFSLMLVLLSWIVLLIVPRWF